MGTTSQPTAPAADTFGLTPADRRQLRRTWTAVAAPLLALNWWILSAGAWTPWQTRRFGDFFDAQGRALLSGRWDVPPEVAGLEGFLIEGRTYLYFGPVPSLLRLPVFLVTDRFDGRLILLSMFAAMVVLTIAAYRLTIAIRAFLRGNAPVTRTERAATAILAVAVLTGTPFWMSSLAIAHHEASLWAIALTIAGLDAVARWMLDPTSRRLATAAALITAAALSRFTLGMGVLASLGAISFFVLIGHIRARRQEPKPTPFVPTPIWVLACVGVAVLTVSSLPNIARFGHPTDIPMERHVFSLNDPHRREFLERSDGAYFSADFVPTALLQYLRPDALHFSLDAPWVQFPESRPQAVGDPFFDALEWSSSVPSTMPALTVLAIPGIGWLAMAVRRRRPEMWLIPLWLGTMLGGGAVLTIAYIGHRYLTDFYPIVLIPALVGFHKLVSLAPSTRATGRRRAGQALAGGLVALTAFGTFTTVALAMQYQNDLGFFVTEETRAAWLQRRAELPGRTTAPLRIPPDERLPDPSGRRVAVVGDCLGVYLSADGRWEPVERGPGVGVYRIRFDADALAAAGTPAPLLTLSPNGDTKAALVVAVVPAPDDMVRVDVWAGADEGWSHGTTAPMQGTVELRVMSDRNIPSGSIRLDNQPLYNGSLGGADHATEALPGRLPDDVTIPGLADTYPGDLELVAEDMATCRALTGG